MAHPGCPRRPRRPGRPTSSTRWATWLRAALSGCHRRGGCEVRRGRLGGRAHSLSHTQSPTRAHGSVGAHLPDGVDVATLLRRARGANGTRTPAGEEAKSARNGTDRTRTDGRTERRAPGSGQPPREAGSGLFVLISGFSTKKSIWPKKFFQITTVKPTPFGKSADKDVKANH